MLARFEYLASIQSLWCAFYVLFQSVITTSWDAMSPAGSGGQHAFPLALAVSVGLLHALTTSGLIISPCLVVRISISPYYLLPFILIPREPRADAHLALFGTTFSAFILCAVSVVFDSFSHNLSAPSELTIACSSEPDDRVFVSMSALLSAFPHAGLWAYPGTLQSTPRNNYLIWGNYS